MRVVVQRVSRAQVSIAERSVGKINRGLMLLVAFNDQDTAADLDYAVRKITNLRIFENEEGKMTGRSTKLGEPFCQFPSLPYLHRRRRVTVLVLPSLEILKPLVGFMMNLTNASPKLEFRYKLENLVRICRLSWLMMVR